MRAVKHLVATAKAPSKEGVFDGTILYNPSEGDSDGERVANFTNTPVTVPLDFQHLIVMDPGSVIGTVKAVEVGDGKTLAVHAELALGTKMADAVFERMELPDEDPMVLKELSIAYAYDPALNTKDANGVVVNHDAELVAISVVHAGAQATKVFNIKSELDVLEKTALAGLISVEQAIEYAEDLGIPGDISQKLFESAATSEGTKYTAPEAPNGSYEERQGEIQKALNAYGGPDSWACIVATYSDRVVACIESLTDEKCLQFPYTYADDEVTLGAPEEVELEVSVVAAAKAKALGEKWSGSSAMASCKSAGDFRKIAFERSNDSDPDTAAHWALPHHSSPGADADKTGVSAALAALNGARGGAPDLKNKSAAQSHLEAHQASFGNKAEEAEVTATDSNSNGEVHVDVIVDNVKAGRVIGAKRVSDLKSSLGAAIDAWAETVNGDLASTEKAEEVTELIEPEVEEKADELTELTSVLDSLIDGLSPGEEEERQGKAHEIAETEVAAAEEIADFRLRLDALDQ